MTCVQTGGFGSVYGGGNYPGYAGTVNPASLPNQIGGANIPASSGASSSYPVSANDIPASYWAHYGAHSTDVIPYSGN